MIYDVIIVGAGPAGSFAASSLSRSGVSVCLFNGQAENEPKACGGGVTTKSFNYYPELMHAAARIVSKVDLHSPTGRSAYINLDDPFAIFSRTELDSFLCKKASHSGTHVVHSRAKLEKCSKGDGGTWKLRATDGSIWEGHTLVAADGVNSSIARHLVGAIKAEEMEVAFGFRVPLSVKNETSATIAFLHGYTGYAWAFPRLDHISFGVATAQSRFDHNALNKLLWSFMINYYRMDDGCASKNWRQWHTKDESGDDNAITIRLKANAKRYAARIPSVSARTWETRRVVGKNWALLGDAAGFADSVTGEGIFYALRSGELFAKAYLSGKLTSYEELWRDDFGAELIGAAKLRNRFYGSFVGSPFTERMIQFARHHSGIEQTLGELIAGEQSYTGLKRKLVIRAPKL